jgi:hypothetical protein
MARDIIDRALASIRRETASRGRDVRRTGAIAFPTR